MAVIRISRLTFGRTVTPVRLAAVRRLNCRAIAAVVVFAGLAFGQTIPKIRGAAKLARNFGSVSTVVVISRFAFGRTIFPIFGTAIRRGDRFPVLTVVGIGAFADRRTGRRIIFIAAVLPFVNPGRTVTAGILSAAAGSRYQTRIRTVGRSVFIFRPAGTAFIFAAAGSALADLVRSAADQSRIALTGNILAAAALSDPILPRRTAYQIRRALTAQTVSRIIRTNPVNGLYRVAVLFAVTFVQTLLNRIHAIIVSGSEPGVGIAVADAQKTD